MSDFSQIYIYKEDVKTGSQVNHYFNDLKGLPTFLIRQVASLFHKGIITAEHISVQGIYCNIPYSA